MAVPVLGVWLRKRFGSFMPLFVVSSACQLIGAALFGMFGRVSCPADDPIHFQYGYWWGKKV
jgi:hypothetical protein